MSSPPRSTPTAASPSQSWDVVVTIMRVVRRRLGFPVMLAGLALALLVWGGAVALVSFSVSAG